MAESRLFDAYRLATAVAHPLAGPLISWRMRQGKEDAERISERYGIASLERPEGPLVWIHAASVGETVSVLPLAERIGGHSDSTVLLTTGTVTSAEIASKHPAPRLLHQYAPLDGRRFVRRFLEHWRPGLAIFAESELWPNMIVETTASGGSLALVNGRMSERSFARWRRHAPGMARHLLSRFALCLAQSPADAERLTALGARHARDVGNLKFDVPPPPAAEIQLKELTAALGGRPCWLAASVHPGEDAAILDAHRLLAQKHPEILTFLAPRHPERGKEMAAMAAAAGLNASLRSVERNPPPGSDIFIFDSIGELGLAFRLASIAFIGGSLVAHGGQNPIEAAKLEAVIMHGPHVANFREVYSALDEAGGALTVHDGSSLAATVAKLLDMPEQSDRCRGQAAEVVKRFSGALDRTIDALEPMLSALAGERR